MEFGDQQVSGGGGADHERDHQNDADGLDASDDGQGDSGHQAKVKTGDGQPQGLGPQGVKGKKEKFFIELAHADQHQQCDRSNLPDIASVDAENVAKQ